VLWRSVAGLQLTVIVKAALEPVDGDLMRLVGPVKLELSDHHIDDDPTRSLLTASDVVPYRPRADVWLTGHACAPAARPVAVSIARLALYRDGRAIIDKSVHVVGKRTSAAQSPVPFSRMPLVYERAFGGIGFDANPVGVGADERPLWPNIVDPRDPERPAGFGPVSRYWKLRRAKVSTALRRQLEEATPQVPADMPWTYFQAAPLDQRVDFLRGDEWLVLDGVHPAISRLQTRLPKLQGVARLFAQGSGGVESGQAVALVADALSIDADRQRCALTWRGSVSVSSPDPLSALTVAGAVCPFGGAVDWSTLGPVTEAAPVSATTRAHGRPHPASATAVSPQSDSAQADEEAGAELLGQTRIDPPSSDRETGVQAAPLPSATKTEIDAPALRYPRSLPDFDEVTDTTVDLTVEGDPRSVTLVQRQPQVTDTEPGEAPPADEDDLPWVHEPAVEPADEEAGPSTARNGADAAATAQASRATPLRPRAASLPPGPPDLRALERSLRAAGASDEDIVALLEALGSTEP